MLAVFDLLCRATLVAVEKPMIFFVKRDWFPVKQDISDVVAFRGYISKGQTFLHLDLQFLNLRHPVGKSGSCASSLLSTA